MRDDISLRKLARSAELLLQFVVEAKVDIHLLVTGAVKRAGGCFGGAAWRLCRIAKQNQLGVPVWNFRLIGQQLVPCVLHIIKDEGNELHFTLFAGSARTVRIRNWCAL